MSPSPQIGRIMATPFAKWMEVAAEKRLNVVMTPLAPEYQALFDERKAADFFRRVNGTRYGFYNMVFSWIDTPRDNYPPPLSLETVRSYGLCDAVRAAVLNTVRILYRALSPSF